MALANKVRPISLNDVIGNDNIKEILFKMNEKGNYFSFVLYGKSGIGKTTLVRIFIKEAKMPFYELNGVDINKKALDDVIKANNDKKIIVIDEIHRLTKPLQQLLLPFVESGEIILIGMTTENPYYSLVKSLRSRIHIFELETPSKDLLIDKLKAINNTNFETKLDDEIYNLICNKSNYDVRSCINHLELIHLVGETKLENCNKLLNKEHNIGSIDDKYNLISALQKSIRGSDVDASLYYAGKLYLLGDMELIYRRLIVIAYEDISIGNELIGLKVKSAIEAMEFVGYKESRIILANVIVEMALSPKSNSAYKAFDSVLFDLRNNEDYGVNEILVNNNKRYKYPFDYNYNIVKQNYFPNGLNKKYLKLNDYPSNEKKLKSVMDKIDTFLKNTLK